MGFEDWVKVSIFLQFIVCVHVKERVLACVCERESIQYVLMKYWWPSLRLEETLTLLHISRILIY